MIVDGSLGCLHCRLEEGIGVARKYERERYLHAVDAQIVSHHVCLYKVLLVARIDNGSKRIHYKFRI